MTLHVEERALHLSGGLSKEKPPHPRPGVEGQMSGQTQTRGGRVPVGKLNRIPTLDNPVVGFPD